MSACNSFIIEGEFCKNRQQKSTEYEHALTTIRLANSHWVWLCVSSINYRAQAFYEKLGFANVGTGPILEIGRDKLTSSILALRL